MEIKDVTEAMRAMEYLAKRELLCESCVWNLAELRNQFHVKCAACSKEFRGECVKVKTNEFERCLCDALHRWFATNSATAPAVTDGTAGPAADSLNSGTP